MRPKKCQLQQKKIQNSQNAKKLKIIMQFIQKPNGTTTQDKKK